jgi:hypothetical protein
MQVLDLFLFAACAGGVSYSLSRPNASKSNIYASPGTERVMVVGFAVIITVAVIVRVRNRHR